MARLSAENLTELNKVGRFGKAYVLQRWKGIYYVRKKALVVNIKSPAVKRRQNIFAAAVAAYKKTSWVERILWRSAAHKTGMSGYEAFLSHYLHNH